MANGVESALHEGWRAGPKALLARPSPARSRMILIVDDQLDGGTALARLLKRCGHDAVAVGDGSAALSLLQATRPDVLVLDYHMPDMSGLDVMRTLRADARNRDIPVIFYSADADPDAVAEAIELGAKDYLIKASTPWEQVRDTVDRYATA
jgi:CheY-like chemotaxis protein